MASPMSALKARKPLKTYSRQKRPSLPDEEPPTKRRRVDTPAKIFETETSQPISSPLRRCDAATHSSSPKDSHPVFSDAPVHSTPPSSPSHERSSPPSSPPPTASSPRLKFRRPMFSSLKRKSAKESTKRQPLSERNDNTSSLPQQPSAKNQRLVQMQLDLVSQVQKTCKVCGMEYIPSNIEDAALHKKFHAMNVGGIDVTKAMVQKLREKQVWAGGNGSFIAVVRRTDTLACRNKTTDVLKIINMELGAVTIAEEALWSQVRVALLATTQAGEGKAPAPATGSASDRFKTYLYIRGQKCVGACLAERIQEAYTVLARDDASDTTDSDRAQVDSSSVSVSDKTEPAILGISRIWTSNMHRKEGIATRLLDAATSDFLYGMTIDRSLVAFSQPTESGGQLARKWFGQRSGWHVYSD
ncbi:sister chromatid cohesion acetyltransferas-like protein Eco1 [Polyplosphaeria fusca]|uniref:Sister chromatid cohesion acetyltransferas-like protein Eco1 n=1 Tax=Polyplosphaeria fusca TaxID=682080 RepID=A0A9P4UXR8_9PLEO|nr:sister chromatid cohesion acetyltransferas-like protein Eco1 [Polyplosphaeria fusca]